MTQKQLNKLMQVWQVRLGLQDWTLTVAIDPKMNNTNTYGETEIRSRWKEGDILLRENDTHQEVTLVHELLHLKFPYLSLKYGNSPGVDVYEEELELGIESLARTFVELAQ